MCRRTRAATSATTDEIYEWDNLLTSLKKAATAMATSLTPSASAAVLVSKTPTMMASATTSMSVCCELDVCGVCNGPGEINECGCADIPEGDCDCNGNVFDGAASVAVTASLLGNDCDGNQLDALASAAVNRTTMGTAYATPMRSRDAPMRCLQLYIRRDGGRWVVWSRNVWLFNFLFESGTSWRDNNSADQWHSAQRPGMVSDMFGRIAGVDSGLGRFEPQSLPASWEFNGRGN